MKPSPTQPADVRVGEFTFNSTEVELSAVTAEGRLFLAETFGAGAISLRLAKSQLPKFAAFAAEKGVTVG